jgi:glutaredoxin
VRRARVKTVTLYTKLGCHLCEAVEAVIEQVGRRWRFELVRRDITHDAGDFEKYQHEVPVVLVDGVEIARHRVTESDLLAALK